jgi:hypothetical protein
MRTIARLLVLAVPVLTFLSIASPATAEIETFELQWTSYFRYLTPTWREATTTVSLEPWTEPIAGGGTGYHLYGQVDRPAASNASFQQMRVHLPRTRGWAGLRSEDHRRLGVTRQYGHHTWLPGFGIFLLGRGRELTAG